jgi:hypothetical protein
MEFIGSSRIVPFSEGSMKVDRIVVIGIVAIYEEEASPILSNSGCRALGSRMLPKVSFQGVDQRPDFLGDDFPDDLKIDCAVIVDNPVSQAPEMSAVRRRP